MIANPPGNCAFLTGRGCLVRLTFDTKIHDVIAAYSAVVHDYVPGPQGHRVQLFHLESLLALSLLPIWSGGFLSTGRGRSICHIDVGHISRLV